jgi:ABC-type dipeptide/oligopeptide/nickel transport system permease subunit
MQEQVARPPWIRQTYGRGVRSVRVFAQRSPYAAAWGVVALLLILMAIAAPVLAPQTITWFDVDKIGGAPPDTSNLLGTDTIGRDMLSRIIYGARISLFVALCSVFLGTTAGAIWGIATGYIGGKFDLASERLVEIWLSIPGLILAFLLVLAIGASVTTVIIAIGTGYVPGTERIIRSVVLSVKETPYVDGARAVGASPLRIMARHVAPQCIAPYLVLATMGLGGAIIAEASLSFLGLGIRPPTPSWGNMLGEASILLYPLWWYVVFPGVFITLTVMSFNLFGDGIRDALDPRLRGNR